MAAPRRLSPKAMAAQVEAFNAKHSVGDTIHVWSGLREGEPIAVQIAHEAQILGGHTPVVYVTGARYGSIALSHVREAR